RVLGGFFPEFWLLVLSMEVSCILRRLGVKKGQVWSVLGQVGAFRRYCGNKWHRVIYRTCPCNGLFYRLTSTDGAQATLASVAPVFAVMKFDKAGNIMSFERKKTELYQELGLQARDLRFQHLVSINSRNGKIILRMEFLKAVISPQYLLILDYRNLHLEQWIFRELAPQLAGEGQLVTYSLPFEFRALEAILQHR
ncbi:hypothetical protein GDO86_017930, partial [Hymenochirus boettgeri]